MPAQDRVRGKQGGHFCQELAAEDLAFDGESASLVVSEQDAAVAELLFQDLVFGAQVVDDLLLLAIDPAGEASKENQPGL